MFKKSPLAPAQFPALAPVAGVRVSGIAAGLKESGRPDLFLAEFAKALLLALLTHLLVEVRDELSPRELRLRDLVRPGAPAERIEEGAVAPFRERTVGKLTPAEIKTRRAAPRASLWGGVVAVARVHAPPWDAVHDVAVGHVVAHARATHRGEVGSPPGIVKGILRGGGGGG